MPFEQVTGRSFTAREAIEHSVAKYREIVSWETRGNPPEWFKIEMVYASYCACCQRWFRPPIKIKDRCPLSGYQPGTVCGGSCRDEWTTMKNALNAFYLTGYTSAALAAFALAMDCAKSIFAQLEAALVEIDGYKGGSKEGSDV